jgi:hypothetical protein
VGLPGRFIETTIWTPAGRGPAADALCIIRLSMAYKSNELLGAADKLIQFITDNIAELTAKNVTPGPLSTSVANAKTDTLQKETAQEAIKQQMKALTAAYELSAQMLYDLLSSIIDVCAGALGKKSAKGKQVLAIRKQLNKSRGGGGSVDPGTSGS